MLRDIRRHRIPLPGRDVEIAVIDWGGDGPPALLHHANGFCGALWDGVAEGLRHRYRLFAVDARGHGDSSRPGAPDAFRWSTMADDLAVVGERLLAQVGAARFALGLGHSFGGTLTLTAAARHPGLYERAVLVDPVLRPQLGEAPAPDSPGPILARRTRRRRFHWGSRAEAREWLAARPLFRHWEPRALELYVAEGLRDLEDGEVELKCAPAVEAAIFGGDLGMDPYELAKGVREPFRLLWAEDGNFPRAFYEQITADMEGGSVETLAAGHLVPMERPDLVIDAVLRFRDEGEQG